MLRRAPAIPGLADFVETFWLQESVPAPSEHALPTGSMSLVVRLTDDPIRIAPGPAGCAGAASAAGSRERTNFGLGALGGARSSFYAKAGSDHGAPVKSVGVQFSPGGAAALLGLRADEFAERHTRLSDLWGERFEVLRERMGRGDPIGVLERELAAALPAARALHPAVGHVLARLTRTPWASISAVRDETGLSHRRLVQLFTRAVGVGPKVYARTVRFQRTASRLARGAGEPVDWADLALEQGYSDQSHLCREFRRLAGCTPAGYRPLSPDRPGHALGVSSVQYGPPGSG